MTLTEAHTSDTPIPPITLLGPQRKPTLAAALRRLDLDGKPLASVTAGWQDRESDVGELNEYLGDSGVNLNLWQRWQEVLEHDPELAEADRVRRETRDEIQDLYLIGVSHARAALFEMEQLPDRRPSLVERAVEDAVEVLQGLDAKHLTRVAEIENTFYARTAPHERPTMARHRAEVRDQVAQCAGVVIAGGHVAVLLDMLHAFNLAPLLTERPVVAWSAGAMALTDRVVLFNDRSTGIHTDPEVYTQGLGLVRDVVALPGARQRLMLNDAHLMGSLVKRFAPSHCLPLDPGARVECDRDFRLPEGTPVLTESGGIAPLRREVESVD
ncbi:hypothetical protein [Demetria terragena]|uniref:hypothetical protein n=1 Tax=Demetria terragena TaxID=63959 RepID=UPI0003758EDC|nr:hypothetical protein [Demetria terragena]